MQSPAAEYVLLQGDVVRLGQVIFQVFLTSGKSWVCTPALSSLTSNSNLPYTPPHSRDENCRICHESDTDKSPLVSICKCKGSIRCIHVSCLKTWVNINATRNSSQGVTSIYCKNFMCDVCEAPYPCILSMSHIVAVVVNDVHYPLFEGLDMDGENLLLCSVSRDGEYAKVFHLIRPDETRGRFTLGRSHSVDIRLKNQYVSRMHAQIVYCHREFRLTDMNSKFGTLVLLRGRQELYREKNLSVQVGSRIITLGIKDRSKIATHCEPHAEKLLLEGGARNDGENREDEAAT